MSHISLLSAACFWTLVSIVGGADAAEHAEPRLRSLEVTIDVNRDGTMEVEYRFELQTDGHEIKRGPILNFLTVVEGPGGLILDDEMEVVEVLRDGRPEAFHRKGEHGIVKLFCGSNDVMLDPGVYSYEVRYVAKGAWTYREGKALGSFDLTGPFSVLPIDQMTGRVNLPDGVEAELFSGALMGNEGEGTGYVLSSEGGHLGMEVTQSLSESHAVFLNAVWPASGFVDQSSWARILRQHPRLPVTVFLGVLLVIALLILVRKITKKTASNVR